MRVTTQMLNESARKAGLPVNNTSLLNYVNGSSQNNSNSLLSALKSKSANKISAVDKSKYEKLEKAAGTLGKQADKFSATGEESLLAKAQATGDYTDVYKELETLINEYNSTLSILASVPSNMNSFYAQNMKELISENSEALESIGITADKSGKLQLNKEKWEAADKTNVAKVLGSEGKLSAKLSFLAGRVENNAESNLESASSGYSMNGDFTSAYLNKYDYRG
ncbi:MAG: hypothetical protein NC092_01890 [Butyrivibrio sp.]|nr:hypothetical protein [Muribaculum sp.]MCM1551424.1 hypothetical protein [Butyrivibrio sp.]